VALTPPAQAERQHRDIKASPRKPNRTTKTNSNIKRLSALILAGNIAAAAAFADATTATRNLITAAPRTTRTAMPTTTGTTALTTCEPVAKLDHGWLGAIAKDSHAPAGYIHRSAPDVRLTRVFRGSPAYNAGLRSGDVIWKFNGTRLRGTTQLKYELRHEKAGEVVPVEIFHHGQREDLKVKLGAARILPRGTRGLTIG
jgi:S1-C subfamily serine protease